MRTASPVDTPAPKTMPTIDASGDATVGQEFGAPPPGGRNFGHQQPAVGVRPAWTQVPEPATGGTGRPLGLAWHKGTPRGSLGPHAYVNRKQPLSGAPSCRGCVRAVSTTWYLGAPPC
jgi:hypothetical protein